MDFIQIIILAVVQGLTEFLPVSSSAHLILFPHLLGWADQGLAFDIAVHLGTLVAVIWYFRHSLRDMCRDWLQSLLLRRPVGDSKLAWAVLLGTIPAGLVGLGLKVWIEEELRAPVLIAWATLGFGLLLWLGDYVARRNPEPRAEGSLGWRDILCIGCAQALALIPGTSRSGVTITAGLLLGLSPAAAARFSFLLSIPVIILACGLSTYELAQAETAVAWSAMGWGVLFSAISAYLCIHYFLKMLERVGLLPFVLYRMVLGLFLLWLFT